MVKERENRLLPRVLSDFLNARGEDGDKLVALIQKGRDTLRFRDTSLREQSWPVVSLARLLAGDRALREEVRSTLAGLGLFEIRPDRCTERRSWLARIRLVGSCRSGARHNETICAAKAKVRSVRSRLVPPLSLFAIHHSPDGSVCLTCCPRFKVANCDLEAAHSESAGFPRSVPDTRQQGGN